VFFLHVADDLKSYGTYTVGEQCAVTTTSFDYASNTYSYDSSANTITMGIDWGIKTTGSACGNEQLVHGFLLSMDWNGFISALSLSQFDISSITYSCKERDGECPTS